MVGKKNQYQEYFFRLTKFEIDSGDITIDYEYSSESYVAKMREHIFALLDKITIKFPIRYFSGSDENWLNF